MLILTIAYGATIGILGANDSSAVAPVAVAGGAVIGGLWVLRSVLGRER